MGQDEGGGRVLIQTMEKDRVRRADVAEAKACAAILNAWIDGTDWMPRVHEASDVERHYVEEVLTARALFVVGQPVAAFLALSDDGFVTALYSAKPGAGLGKRLLDHAKSQRETLQLWTFQANTRAQGFYAREGFREVRRTDGENEEGLPDILFEWTAGT